MQERARIAEPWHRYARQGNSLFLWRFGFYLVTGVLAGGVLLSTAGAALLGWLGFRSELLCARPEFRQKSLRQGTTRVTACAANLSLD